MQYSKQKRIFCDFYIQILETENQMEKVPVNYTNNYYYICALYKEQTQYLGF